MLKRVIQAAPTFYKRPMGILAVGLGAGILAGRRFLFSSAYILALCLVLLALTLYYFHKQAGKSAVHTHIPALPLLLFACALGLIRIQLAYPSLPAPTDSCILSGRIADIPQYSGQAWEVKLTGVYSDAAPIDGNVLLRIKDAKGTLPLQYGQVISCAASLSLPTGKRSDIGRDWRFYYFMRGISCTAYCGDGSASIYAGPPGFYGRLLALRAYTTEVLCEMLGNQNGSVAAAMLHGDTAHIPVDTLTDFRDAGIAHLLAVSGLHVGLLVGALLLCLRHTSAAARLIITALFLTGYCLFTALSPSTLRASLMALCMLTAQVLRRRNDPVSSLCFAFFMILIISPFSLFDVGLQLSFTAVLGILLLQPVLRSLFARLPDACNSALGISIAGQVSTLPITVAYFSRLPALAVIANLLVVPLAALVVLPALLSLPLYPLLPSLAHAIASVAGATLTLIRAVASAVADAGALSLYPPSLSACALYFLALLFLSPLARGQQRAKRWFAGLCFMGSLLLWITPLFARMQPHITVLDTPYGYVAHVHTQQEDLLIADEAGGLYGDLETYLAFQGVRRARLVTGQTRTLLQWGGDAVAIEAGYVETGGVRYEIARTGQLTITLRQGRSVVHAYADEARYGILQDKNKTGEWP